jgi:excisionase family DNA binding protein
VESLRAVMTVDEVAEYLRIPRASVYKLAQRGRIPCQKVGRHWRFRRQSIEAWLDDNSTPRQVALRESVSVDM